jgi:hydroxymethylbilane synthase
VTEAIALRAATRSSPLARWQTDTVAALLCKAHNVLTVDPLFVDTLGDRTQAIGTPLHELGGQGVFVKEVQAAVLRGEADIAVHSAKDLPSTPTPGLVIAAIPLRGDVRDLLIGATLDTLRVGARVGTSSVRRIAQLRAQRPDLEFVQIRGNVGTRVARVGELDAVIVAAAGAERLGLIAELAERHTLQWLPVEVMLPMVAQGALAVECRSDDARTRSFMEAITDPVTAICVLTERAFLARLGGGCDLPVGALATLHEHGDTIEIDALVAEPAGGRIVRAQLTGPTHEPESLGRSIAETLLAEGGQDLLDAR